MTICDIGESLWCRAAWNSTSPGSLFPSTPLSEPGSCEGRGKRSYSNRLAEAMAAFTAPCATSNTMDSTVARTAWRGQGSSKEAGACESGDLGHNTILEKTHEFFQMCDIENKGFINRRDMQVRLLIQGRLPWPSFLKSCKDWLPLHGSIQIEKTKWFTVGIGYI